MTEIIYVTKLAVSGRPPTPAVTQILILQTWLAQVLEILKQFFLNGLVLIVEFVGIFTEK